MTTTTFKGDDLSEVERAVNDYVLGLNEDGKEVQKITAEHVVTVEYRETGE